MSLLFCCILIALTQVINVCLMLQLTWILNFNFLCFSNHQWVSNSDACESFNDLSLVHNCAAHLPFHGEPYVVAKDRLSLPLAPSVSASSLLKRQRFQPESSYHYDLPVAPRAASTAGFSVPGDLIRPEEPKWIILSGSCIYGLSVFLIHLAVGGLISQHCNGHRKVNISL